MARRINLGDNIHKLAGSLFHQRFKFGLCVVSILSGEARIGVTFQAEGAGGLHPVVVKILLKAVVVKVQLQSVHLIIGHDACQLLDVRHGHKLTAHIEHKATDSILRHVDS